MSITSMVTDPERLTLTATAEYDVTAERAWQLWDDPRQLERWWGPPAYPATVVDHDLRAGGKVTYFMTGPSGDQPRGVWDVDEVVAPRRLVVRHGFADDSGEPVNPALTARIQVDIADREGGGVVVTITNSFGSIEAMEQLMAMQMEEGLRGAMSQIDDILAA